MGACKQGTGQCACYSGYTGTACNECEPRYIQLVHRGPCIYMPGALATCTDGVKDGNELGVDCGGPNCKPCGAAHNSLVVSISVTVSCVVVVGTVLVYLYHRVHSGKGLATVKPNPLQLKLDPVSRKSVVAAKVTHVAPQQRLAVAPSADTPRSSHAYDVPDHEPSKKLSLVMNWVGDEPSSSGKSPGSIRKPERTGKA